MNINEAYVFLGKPKIDRLAVVDATKIAENIIGRPIPNTVIAASFAKASGLIKLDSIFEGIRRRFTGSLAEKNILAAKIGYNSTIVERIMCFISRCSILAWARNTSPRYRNKKRGKESTYAACE